MAHEVAGAGHGFLWPRLTLGSDGEWIEAVCRPSNPLSSEPIRYLADFSETVEALSFERTIDEFMSLVLARLDAVGVASTDLRQLWEEVLEERANPGLAGNRKLEAQLGFEPDDAPGELIYKLVDLSQTAGTEAGAELAAACAGSQPDLVLNEIVEFSKSGGVTGRVSVPPSLSQLLTAPHYRSAAPWKRGWLVAQAARHSWGFDSQPLSDKTIADLLHVSVLASHNKGRLGLAIRRQDTDDLKLLFHKRNLPGLRFEAARFIADHILSPVTEQWLPATDAKTARQKVQRAFAAEFLCPITALQDFLDGDFSPEMIEAAGDHFGVSELAVESHLANHGLIPPEAVTVQ